MARAIIQADKNRVVFTMFNVQEKMALLRLPSRRWLQQAQMFTVPLNRVSAAAMLEAVKSNNLGLAPDVVEVLQKTTASRIRSREFPKWYVHKGPAPFLKQREGSTKLYKVDTGFFACQMGTGKSKMVIDVLSAHFMELRFDAVVVICPNTVKTVWPLQIAEHCPIPAILHDGDSSFDHTLVIPRKDKINWVLVGVEALSQGHTFSKVLPLISSCRCAIVVDESHDIKNAKSIRTERAIELGKNAVLKYALTGTPILKNLIDLYAQYEFLDPNIIGTGDYFAFRNRYAIMGGFKNKQIVGYNNVDELMGLIEPYTFQCLKKEVVDIPDKTYTERVLTMSDDQRKLYDKVKKAEVGEVSVAHVLTRILRLHQIAGGFLKEDDVPMMGLDGKPLLNSRGKPIMQRGADIPVVAPDKNPKLLELRRICEENPGQMAVWSRYLPEIEAIKKVLSEFGPVASITGDTPKDEKAAIIAGFESGLYKYYVGTQMAGGVGTTLIAAEIVVYYSNTYSLKDRQQSEDRAHRIGQTKNVLYIDLMMDKSVDKIIKRAFLEKKDLAEYVAEQLGAKITITKLLEAL